MRGRRLCTVARRGMRRVGLWGGFLGGLGRLGSWASGMVWMGMVSFALMCFVGIDV